jgi:hypothetical protein
MPPVSCRTYQRLAPEALAAELVEEDAEEAVVADVDLPAARGGGQHLFGKGFGCKGK